MQAIILAAGEGVRMRPLTLTKPKSLIKVNGKPLIQHAVEALPESIDELIIVLGYLGEQIQAYCGEHLLGRPVTYVWQKQKTGTARALQLCKAHLKPGKFAISAAPDDLLDPAAWRSALQYDLCVITNKSAHPENFGVLVVDDNGVIQEFIEKPQHFISNLINTNSMVMDERIFNYEPDIHSNGEYYLTTMVSKLAKDVPVHTVTADLWIPVGTPEDIAKAEEYLINKNE